MSKSPIDLKEYRPGKIVALVASAVMIVQAVSWGWGSCAARIGALQELKEVVDKEIQRLHREWTIMGKLRGVLRDDSQKSA